MAAAANEKNASNNRPTRPEQSQSHNAGHIQLDGWPHISPFAQGDLDHLCGVYAIINALRLIRQPLAPMSLAKSRQLFDDAIGFLSSRNILQTALVNGISARNWKLLAAFLASRASTTQFAIDVGVFSGKKSTRAIMQCIDDSMANGWPILLHLGRRHQHYTVIVASTPHNIILCDSWRLLRVKRAHFVKRHDITASTMMRLTVQLRI